VRGGSRGEDSGAYYVTGDVISPRLQFARTGAAVFATCRDGIDVFDTETRRRRLEIPDVDAFAAFADQVWTVRGDTLERWSADGRRIGLPAAVTTGEPLTAAFAGPPAAAMGDWMWVDDVGAFHELPIARGSVPFVGRRTIGVGRGGVVLGTVTWPLPIGAQLAGAAAVFDAAGVALLVQRAATVELWCSTASGNVQYRITLPGDAELRLAARRGVLLVREAEQFVAIDLRNGRALGRGTLHAGDIAIDPDARRLALLVDDRVELVALADAMARTEEPAPVPSLPPQTPAPTTTPPPAKPAPRDRGDRSERLHVTRPLELAGFAPRVPTDVERADAVAQLDAELRVVLRRAVLAIAHGWNTRRLGYPNESSHPYEHEVAAILGINRGFAEDHVTVAERELALEPRPPRGGALAAVAADLALSPLAVDILLAVAAPSVWGEIARLYGILANDPGRPIVDEMLVSQLLGVSRHDVARELDARAPLVRTGAIQVGSGPRLFAALTADPVVIARLRAEPPDLGPAVTMRAATVALEQLDVPAPVLAAALAELARARSPLRIVIRGRSGSGRRTTLAALAAEAQRALGVIDAALIPNGGLAAALRRVHLAGSIPCVIGLDRVEISAADALRAHAGPLALCLLPDAAAPLDPGHVAIELPLLGETERLAVWRRDLTAAGFWVRDVEGLAARYRIGPGVIRRAIGAVAGHVGADDDATAAIDGYIRQARDAHIGTVARRVDRLATWSSLVLPPDVMDSLRELVARVRHRRRVFEDWGMGATVTTARGLTALFQGQPGTGKTLVAGVIARELGLDLYQVDLSRIMSKWIGETEANLARVFDAAEDGQVVLLFDEADSLFARRTQVQSSNDRYANLEVNYLLQRLDAFDGIAILTTNFGGSIDPAFKRRLSFRLTFPFPDEDTRARLWRAHLPPQLPTTGELGVEALAHKYQLSGGYIRNACLRAAFLAAQDDGPLVRDHLERAVALELHEAGKLSSTGALS
jgi:ATPase family protein associated with various cellular activities (AAA)